VSAPNIQNITKEVDDVISSGQFSICVPVVDKFPTAQAGPFSFIVVCMCCGKEKSRNLKRTTRQT